MVGSRKRGGASKRGQSAGIRIGDGAGAILFWKRIAKTFGGRRAMWARVGNVIDFWQGIKGPARMGITKGAGVANGLHKQ